MDVAHENGFEAAIEKAFREMNPFNGIAFSVPTFRYSEDGNFSGRVNYEHAHGSGVFELQISYRLALILERIDLPLVSQPYFGHVEFSPPLLHGLDPYEMIGEKIMACNRRRVAARRRTSMPFTFGPAELSTTISCADSPAQGLDRPAQGAAL
jgi:hypothetical protein